MKKLLFLFAITTLIPLCSFAQNIRTQGPNSPIIKGANAKVNYIISNATKLSISPELSKYLAGLLIFNDIGSDTSSIKSALAVWIKKYKELKIEIGKVQNAVEEKDLRQHLEQGDFGYVESRLQLKTNYNELVSTFPNTFQSRGDKSPVIFGNYAVVTYVVNEVISVDLDETVVKGILKELQKTKQNLNQTKTQLNNINAMTIELSSSDKTQVINYINSYQRIKEELSKSPKAVFRRAIRLFNDGEYDKVLAILDSSAKNNDREFGEINLIKAHILLFRRFDYPSLDSIVNEIDRSYFIAAQIIRDSKIQIEYGKFLVEIMGNYQSGISYLERNVELINSFSKKMEIYNYLNMAYQSTDKIKGISYLERALNLVNSQQLVDDSILIQKAKILSNLGQAYATSYYDRESIKKAINFSTTSLDIISKLRDTTEDVQALKGTIDNQLGKEYLMIGDTMNAEKYYNQSMRIWLQLFSVKPDKYCYALAVTYYSLSEMEYTKQDYETAIDFLEKARVIIQPRATPDNKFLISSNESIYTALVTNYILLNKVESAKDKLIDLDMFMKPISAINPSIYRVRQASIHTDLGEIYNTENKFDSAEFYLNDAYTYYIENINSIQADKYKVSKCFWLYNLVLIHQAQLVKAKQLNWELLAIVNRAATLNKINYQDFIPQVNSQFAEIHLAEKNYDSAIYYSNLAISVVGPMSKQYGVLYSNFYHNMIIQACNIHLLRKSYLTADSIASSYIADYSSDRVVDPFVKENFQGQVGDFISGLATNFMKYNDSVNVSKQLFDIFPIIDRYFSSAGPHYVYAYNKNLGISNSESIRYATYLLNYLEFANNWQSKSSKSSEKRLTSEKRQLIAQKANEILSTLPYNHICNSLRDRYKKEVLSVN